MLADIAANVGRSHEDEVRMMKDMINEKSSAWLDDDHDEDVIKDSNEAEWEEKDYTKMTVAQLKDQLRDRGLKVSGRKAELIERLKGAV